MKPQKHGKVFRVRYYNEGNLQIETFSSFEAANTRCKEIAWLKSRQVAVEAKPHTIKFSELSQAVLDDYKVNNRRSYTTIEMRFRVHITPYFGHMKAIAIHTSHLKAYIVHRLDAGAANGTINREMEAMKRAFHLGIQDGTVQSMPHIPRLTEASPRQGFFTREEVDRVCSHLKDPVNSFVLFAFLTGWRLNEIRNLKWSNVDFDRGQIRLEPGETKNGEGRTFPLTNELRTLLEGLKRDRFLPYCFIRFRRQIGDFEKSWANACSKAKLSCVVDQKTGLVTQSTRLFHDLRRSGVRELARVLGERRAMARTGHKTRSVFDRYNVVSDFDLAEDRKLLDEFSGMSKSVSKPNTGKS